MGRKRRTVGSQAQVARANSDAARLGEWRRVWRPPDAAATPRNGVAKNGSLGRGAPFAHGEGRTRIVEGMFVEQLIHRFLEEIHFAQLVERAIVMPDQRIE